MVCSAPAASVSSVRRPPSLARRPLPADLTVEATIGLYLDSLFARGVLKVSRVTAGNQLRQFFASALPEPLRNLSPQRTRQLADALAREPRARTGHVLAPSTQRSIAECARRFTRWCAAQGRLPADPMAAANAMTLAEKGGRSWVKLLRKSPAGSSAAGTSLHRQ